MKYDLTTDFEAAKAAAGSAIGGGELVVMPTDTVYGVGADAFSPPAVQRLLDAKGRDRTMPPPVLIGDAATIGALTVDVPAWVHSMIEELWPGALTIICRAQPSLQWDLGETRGTVALRVPAHDRVRDILRTTGPLAVSSANRTGLPPARDVDKAQAMLGDTVSVYLDGGPSSDASPSTILDVTRQTAQILRSGGVPIETLHRFNNTIVPPEDGPAGSA